MLTQGEQTSLYQRKMRAASRMVLGFHGLQLPQEIRSFQNQMGAPAGYILFGRNVSTPEQVHSLNKELSELTSSGLRSVDQEGGRVRRIKEVAWPTMRKLGLSNDIELTKKIAAAMSDELLALGFNTDWAPVCDVDSNPDNPVIGDRSFSRDPEICARHAVAFLETAQSKGILCSAKHFPGHGDTDIDSHLDLPTVDRPLSSLLKTELPPFKAAIDHGVSLVMTAHVLFPQLDDLPATMSHAILTGILREQLGYTGVIVSDDMEMKAVRGRYPLNLQLDKSCRAGVDLFLVCSEYELQEEIFEQLVYLQEHDAYHDHLAEQSLKRIQDIQHRSIQNTTPPALSLVGCSEHRHLVSTLMELS